jgi:hypothetical protein
MLLCSQGDDITVLLQDCHKKPAADAHTRIRVLNDTSRPLLHLSPSPLHLHLQPYLHLQPLKHFYVPSSPSILYRNPLPLPEMSSRARALLNWLGSFTEGCSPPPTLSSLHDGVLLSLIIRQIAPSMTCASR